VRRVLSRTVHRFLAVVYLIEFLPLDDLLDEPAPSFTAAVAKHDAPAIGNSGNGVPVGVAKRVAHRFLAHLLRSAPPDVSILIAKTEMLPIPESIQARGRRFVFEVEETTGHLTVNPSALEDAFEDHQTTIRLPQK